MALAWTKSISSNTPIHIYEGELDLASVAAATAAMAEVTITCTGVKSTDMAIAFQPAESGLSIGIGSVRVSADNEISVIFVNTDDAAVDEGAMDFRLFVVPAI